MKPASCFGDLASFSNRQKRLQQNRRNAVDIHNDDFRTPHSVLPRFRPLFFVSRLIRICNGCEFPSIPSGSTLAPSTSANEGLSTSKSSLVSPAVISTVVPKSRPRVIVLKAIL